MKSLGIDLLLTLYSGGSQNDENRGLDTEFARETYVPTELDGEFLDDILGGRYAAVVLTGNPGDGKTAFIQQIALRLPIGRSKPLPIHHWVSTGPSGRTFEAVLDGSASDTDRDLTSDDVIDRLLEPIERAGPEDGLSTRLAAPTSSQSMTGACWSTCWIETSEIQAG